MLTMSMKLWESSPNDLGHLSVHMEGNSHKEVVFIKSITKYILNAFYFVLLVYRTVEGLAYKFRKAGIRHVQSSSDHFGICPTPI